MPRPSTAETIYLVSAGGHPRFGDEFVTAAWLRFLTAARPDADVWLDCPVPGTASHLFDRLHPRLRVTDTLWRLVGETRDMDPENGAAHIDRVVTRLGSPSYDLGLVRAHRASSVHLLGGGYVDASSPHHVGLFRAALRLRDVNGARLAATGLGVTPTAYGDALAKALEGFDHVSVRDAASAELTGAQLVGNDAFLYLRQVAGFRDGTRDDDVWVCLEEGPDQETFDVAVEAVRAALQGPELAGRTVRYLEAVPGADWKAFERLSDLIPPENFVPFIDVWQRGFPARAGQTWFTSRYHFHLLAAACGAEGTALALDGDHQRRHQSLVDAGSGWSVTPPRSGAVTTPSGAGAFRGGAARLRQAKVQEAEALYPEPPRPVAARPVAAQSRGLLRHR